MQAVARPDVESAGEVPRSTEWRRTMNGDHQNSPGRRWNSAGARLAQTGRRMAAGPEGTPGASPRGGSDRDGFHSRSRHPTRRFVDQRPGLHPSDGLVPGVLSRPQPLTDLRRATRSTSVVPLGRPPVPGAACGATRLSPSPGSGAGPPVAQRVEGENGKKDWPKRRLRLGRRPHRTAFLRAWGFPRFSGGRGAVTTASRGKAGPASWLRLPADGLCFGGEGIRGPGGTGTAAGLGAGSTWRKMEAARRGSARKERWEAVAVHGFRRPEAGRLVDLDHGDVPRTYRRPQKAGQRLADGTRGSNVDLTPAPGFPGPTRRACGGTALRGVSGGCCGGCRDFWSPTMSDVAGAGRP